MYGQDFVAGVLAGFEGTLDALMEDVDDDLRAELEELSTRITGVRLRLAPDWAAEGSPEAEPAAPLG